MLCYISPHFQICHVWKYSVYIVRFFYLSAHLIDLSIRISYQYYSILLQESNDIRVFEEG